MDIRTLVLGSVGTNCYIVSNRETKEAIVIDPADHGKEIWGQIEGQGLKLSGIFLTHGHFDHILGVMELAALSHVPVFASEAEKELLEDERMNCSAMLGKGCSITPDRLLKDGERIDLLGTKCKVISTPGHTRGSICYYFEKEKVLFSGDTLFFESIGRTDLPTGNSHLILESIRERLIPLGKDTKVYSGHGPETTIQYELRNNPYIDNREHWE